MKNFILTTVLLLYNLSFLNAQQISPEPYNKALIHEDFNQKGDYFNIVTNTDNYFILDKGDYLLSRNSDESEYAIIANNSIVSDFILKTSVRIGPSENKQASIGIILKAQQDGKGAIIFEINKKGEYRIKQLIGNTYQSLSGRSKDEGWVKNKLLNGVDEHNFIEIRSEKNIYDIYTNSEYLTTFFVPDLTTGSSGLIISPATKARISYYYINIKGEKQIVADYTNNNTGSTDSGIEELNKKIKLLEENNKKLNSLNTNTKNLQTEEITELQKSNTNHKARIIELEQKNKELNNQEITLVNEITNLKDQLSQLKTKNSELASVSVKQEKEISSLNSTMESIKKTSSDATKNYKKLQKKINGLKEQVTLEKAIKTELENDLDKVKKQYKNQNDKLANNVKTLNTEIDALKNTNSTLSTNLSKEKKKYQETKKGLSSSVKNKKAEISKLSNENETLKSIQAQHDKVTSDLNNQINDMRNQIDALQKKQDLLNNELSVSNEKNTELKELFIQKDFEINGVKPSEIIKETSNTPPTPVALKGNTKVYTVQFGVFMQEQSYQSTKQLDDVWYNTTEYGTYVYYSGEFYSPKEAASHQNSLIEKGFKNAFVVTLNK